MKFLKNHAPTLLLFFMISLGYSQTTVSGDFQKWHTVTILFDGPNTSENDAVNPFLDYRLNVTFTSASGNTFVVPGFYAADGNAAETSASSGNKWAVRFTPNETGNWTYNVSFRTASNIAVILNPDFGTPTSFDGESGSFNIAASNKSAPDNRAKGRLNYVGKRYLQFEETGKYFLKAGSDSPENLLAYSDFDNTTNSKTWSPHNSDWNSGDPTWKGNNGRELIGAVNYLSEMGMNAFSFLTMNVIGDGNDVWPWAATNSNSLNGATGSDVNNRLRYDVSKLAQWEILFSHADAKGMFLHFKTQETENDQLLDGGELGTQRKLYYRELIARFGHHLALNWNLGEENDLYDELGDVDGTRIKAYAAYVNALDPYDHHIVIHSYPWAHENLYPPLLGTGNRFTGASMQIGIVAIHRDIKRWILESKNAGKPWVVTNDEQGSAQRGVTADESYSGNKGNQDDNRDEVRHEVLWGTLMAGGGGVEYYFGYNTGETDLTAEDFRSRRTKWEDAKYALDFFDAHVPFWEMETNDQLTSERDDFCLANPGVRYLIYLPEGGSTNLNLSAGTGTFTVKWFDPRNGGNLLNGSITEIQGGASRNIGNPPNNTNSDWVILVEKEGSSTNIPVTGMTLTPSNATIEVGNSTTLNAQIQPTSASNKTVIWSSNNTSVATVNQAGQVTGIQIGAAVITARSEDGDFTDTATISVVPATPCSADYSEQNNLVIIEAENLNAPTGWNQKTSASGYTGTGYIEWEGGDNFNTPGIGVISASIKINNPGTYLFQWRNKVGQGTVSTDFNDSWLRFPDADDFYGEKTSTGSIVYPKGSGKTPEAAGAGGDGWLKVYSSGTIDWSWSTNTNDNNTHQIYVTFDNPGVYTMEISGRSDHHLIDRIALSNNAGNATNLSLPETTCDGDETVPVTGIFVTPDTATMNIGDVLNLSASITPSNATNQNITWTSSDASVASVDQNGEVTALAEGTATIAAITEDGNFSAGSDITVNDNTNIPLNSIRVNPQSLTMTEGDITTLTLQFIPANATNQNVTWTTSDASIATVDQNGQVTAIAEGNVEIVATSEDGNKSTDSDIVVIAAPTGDIPVTGITVSPTTATLNIGEVLGLTAQLIPTNATNTNVTWSSADNNIATVDQNGQVTAISQGVVIIRVLTEDGGFSSESTIEVIVQTTTIPLNSIRVTPQSATMDPGDVLNLNLQFIPANATNKNVTWTSSNTAVATVDGTGQVTAIAPGNVEIVATSEDGNKTTDSDIVVVAPANIPLTGIQITPSSITIDEGDVTNLNVLFTPSNATNQNVSWSSSDDTVATVDQNGLVTGIQEGNVTITATSEDGDHTSESAVEILAVITTIRLNSIKITPQTATLTEGDVLDLAVQFIPANATNKNVTWTSSDTSVATVDQNGQVTTIAPGNVEIVATAEDGNRTSDSDIEVTASTQLIPLNSILVTPQSLSMTEGDVIGLSLQFLPANATNKNVTWTSSDASIATVDQNGQVTAIQRGNVTIAVTSEEGGYVTDSSITVLEDEDAGCGADYEEQNSIVIIEAENLDFASGWTRKTEVTGYTGDAYIEWLGGDNFSTPGSGLIATSIRINTPGTYIFQWRNKVGAGTDSKEHNDSWLRFKDADDFFGRKANGSIVYPKGSGKTPEVAGDGSEGWLKVYSSGTLDWSWSTLTNDNNTHEIYVTFDTPGVYSMEISGRSNNHLIDRIALSRDGVDGTDLSLEETLCNGIESATGISVTPKTASVEEGNTLTLNYEITPANATDKEVSWTSSDAAIATVDQNGLVTGIQEGDVTISVKTNDGGFTDTAAIQVTAIDNGDCGAVYTEIDRRVIIEAENLNVPAGWTVSNAINSYSGSGYLQWEGGDSFNVPGNGFITTKIRINTPGTYRFQWRNRVGKGSSSTDSNDSWIRFPDADDFFGEKANGSIVYPKGSGKTPEANGPGADGWLKAYLGGTTDWTWSTFTSDRDNHNIYVTFDSPGVYTMEISGRSNDHIIDRIVLSNGTNATSLALPETLCDGVPTTPVTGINVTPESANLEVTDIIALTAEVLPINATNQNISWSSSDTAIAIVNQNGEVTALREGLAIITATTEDGAFEDTSSIQIISNSKCGADYVEIDNIVVIEAENLNLSDGWSKRSTVSGHTEDGYIEWTDANSFNTPGNGLVSTQIRINQAGTYLFQWRNKVGQGSDPTESNDAWLRFPDADDFFGEKASTGSIVYPKGSGKFPEVRGSGSDGWLKVYSGGTTDWTWSTFTSDSDNHQVYVTFDNPGVYTMEISGRSTNHIIDRIVLSKDANNATDLSFPETLCGTAVKNSFPRMIINNATAAEGDRLDFSVNLSKPTNERVTVDIAFFEDTATSFDYFTTFKTVTFEPGVTSMILSVPTRDDDSVEDDETFIIGVNEILEGKIADFSDTGIGTIIDSDTNFVIAPNPAPVNGSVTIAGMKSGDYEIALYTMSGEMVQRVKATVEGNVYELRIGNLAQGIYLFRADSIDRSYTERIIVR